MTARRCGARAALALLLVLGCSDSDPGGGTGSDAAPDAAPDGAADAQPPVGDCQAMQRDYVNAIISPADQIDVATTVGAVLQAEDFPRAIPYCSGERPDAD